jgi:hypothetical protein
MPYSLGEKGTHGCSGYPVIKTATGEVMGCHPTAKDAGKQLAALHINEPIKKDDSTVAVNPSYTANPSIPGVGIKYPTKLTAARRNKGYTMKARKPRKAGKVREAQTGADGMSAQSAVSSGGPGGSLG